MVHPLIACRHCTRAQARSCRTAASRVWTLAMASRSPGALTRRRRRSCPARRASTRARSLRLATLRAHWRRCARWRCCCRRGCDRREGMVTVAAARARAHRVPPRAVPTSSRACVLSSGLRRVHCASQASRRMREAQCVAPAARHRACVHRACAHPRACVRTQVCSGAQAGTVTCLHASGDGLWVVTGSSDGTACIWTVRCCDACRGGPVVNFCALAPDVANHVRAAAGGAVAGVPQPEEARAAACCGALTTDWFVRRLRCHLCGAETTGMLAARVYSGACVRSR